MNDMTKELNEFLGSYSGIDGGNPKASIWICGIEHGGNSELPEGPLKPEFKWPSWGDDFRRDHPDYKNWQYHQKVAKLMVALRELRSKPVSPPKIDGWGEYLEDELYVFNGDCSKLNLFPLSSPSVVSPAWQTSYSKRLGLESKVAYYERCRDIRFPFLRKVREEFKPKVILGTGKTFRKDFAHAFGFEPEWHEHLEINDGCRRRDCYVYEDADGLLIVCPFFGGRYGINSDGLLIELAKLIETKSSGR